MQHGIRTFDGVVIGGGHNGLVLAAYLSRAGLRVAVLEARSAVGGAFDTVNESGFLHSRHAVHLKLHLSPIIKDLSLREFGVRLGFPEVKLAALFLDAPPLVFFRDAAQTLEFLSRASSRDAHELGRLLPIWRRWLEVFLVPLVYNPPSAHAGLLGAIAGAPTGKEFLRVCQLTPVEFATEVFQDVRFRRVLVWALCAQGYMPDYVGLPPIVLFTALAHLTQPMALGLGGTNQVAKGLQRCIEASGGEIISDGEVVRILVDAGRANGVQLADGQTVIAKRFVASAINPVRTLLELINPAEVPGSVARRLQTLEWDEWSLFGVHVALREPPRYGTTVGATSADMAFKTLLCGEADVALDSLTYVRSGVLSPRPRLGVGCLSVHDPTLAPPGGHVAYAWEAVPANLVSGGISAWEGRAPSRMEECLSEWQKYAPNVAGENIRHRFAHSPLDIVRTMPNLVSGGLNVGRLSGWPNGEGRPLNELSEHRTPIEGLYLCGASMHPGGGATGAPGYNAAGVIADDLSVPRWWRVPSVGAPTEFA